MPFLQLRIATTQPPDCSNNFDDQIPTGRTNHRVLLLLRKLRRYLIEKDSKVFITAGYEILNKYGETQNCTPHFHLHASFESWSAANPLRSIKEYLKREAAKLEFTLRGNREWSCTLVEEPKDYERWQRYPYKETPIILSHKAHDINAQIEWRTIHAPLAQAERRRSIEINILQRQKLANKTTLKDKLFNYLDASFNLPNSNPNHKSIWLKTLNYYTQEGKSVNPTTITGYAILYQLHIKQITPEDLYEYHFSGSDISPQDIHELYE